MNNDKVDSLSQKKETKTAFSLGELFRKYYLIVKNYIVFDLLRANDTPHRLALGVAIGMFVAFTPTIPFQMMLTVLLSYLFQSNKAVGLPVVWITNPATVIPIYLPQYLLGCFLTGASPEDVDWNVLIQDHGGFWQYCAAAWGFMEQIFIPLWVGSLFVSTILAFVSYYLVKVAVVKYRERRYGPR